MGTESKDDPELAEGVRYFKEEGGKKEMCEMVEEYAAEREKYGIEKGISRVIINMQAMDFTLDQIAVATGRSIDAVKAILEEHTELQSLL